MQESAGYQPIGIAAMVNMRNGFNPNTLESKLENDSLNIIYSSSPADELISTLSDINIKYRDSADEIISAYNFADQAHLGKNRESGRPFIVHPVEVALLTALYGGSKEQIKLALLHDVVEITDTNDKKISKLFGIYQGNLVAAMTELRTDYGSNSPIEIVKENHIKELIEYSKENPDIILPWLADRASNLRTIHDIGAKYNQTPEERKRRILGQSEQYHLPVAYDFNQSLGNYFEHLIKSAKEQIDHDKFIQKFININ